MRRWTECLLAFAALLFAAAPAWASSPFFVFFAPGGTHVRPEDEAILDNVVAAIRTVDVRSIEITGYADRAGSESYNLALSRRRAEAVRDALLARGMSRHVLVSIVANGETQLLSPTEDGVADARNRVVVIIPVSMCRVPDEARATEGVCATPLPN